jgi:hypothetical protein
MPMPIKIEKEHAITRPGLIDYRLAMGLVNIEA